MFGTSYTGSTTIARRSTMFNRFLAHHGVMGMKWGVWNEETRRKYGGALHGRKFKAYDMPVAKNAVFDVSKMEIVVKAGHRGDPKKDFQKYAKAFRKELEQNRMDPEPLEEAITKVNPHYYDKNQQDDGYFDNCTGCILPSWFMYHCTNCCMRLLISATGATAY